MSLQSALGRLNSSASGNGYFPPESPSDLESPGITMTAGSSSSQQLPSLAEGEGDTREEKEEEEGGLLLNGVEDNEAEDWRENSSAGDSERKEQSSQQLCSSGGTAIRVCAAC